MSSNDTKPVKVKREGGTSMDVIMVSKKPKVPKVQSRVLEIDGEVIQTLEDVKRRITISPSSKEEDKNKSNDNVDVVSLCS